MEEQDVRFMIKAPSFSHLGLITRCSLGNRLSFKTGSYALIFGDFFLICKGDSWIPIK